MAKPKSRPARAPKAPSPAPEPATPGPTALADAASARILALGVELEAQGLASPAVVDRRVAHRKARHVPDAVIQLFAARARLRGGELGGIPFDPVELETYLEQRVAIVPLVRLLRGLADRIESRALDRRAEIAQRIKAAHGALAAHARLGGSSEDGLLLDEIRGVRPRRKKPRG